MGCFYRRDLAFNGILGLVAPDVTREVARPARDGNFRGVVAQLAVPEPAAPAVPEPPPFKLGDEVEAEYVEGCFASGVISAVRPTRVLVEYSKDEAAPSAGQRGAGALQCKRQPTF